MPETKLHLDELTARGFLASGGFKLMRWKLASYMYSDIAKRWRKFQEKTLTAQAGGRDYDKHVEILDLSEWWEHEKSKGRKTAASKRAAARKR